MVFEFRFPDVGEGLHEARLVKWLVKQGDAVKADQPVAEVETDKAVVEIPCPQTGVMLKQYFKDGDAIKVGQVLFTVGQPGETARENPNAETPALKPAAPAQTRDSTPAPATPPAPTPQPSPQPPPTPQNAARQTPAHTPSPQPARAPGSPVLASPAMRALARQLGVNVDAIQGTGPAGRITEDDLKRAKAGGAPAPTTPTPTPATPTPAPAALPYKPVPITVDGPVERTALNQTRRIAGERLTASWLSAPAVTHVDEADVTALWELRAKEKVAAEAKGVKLTFLPFIAKAIAAALKTHPALNASVDWEKKELVVKKYYNFGIAADTPDGLVVPVVKDVDKKSVLDIARELGSLSEKARAHKLAPDDVKGGTLTITNIGSYGGLFATPILNPPETAIIGVYRIRDQPRAVNGQTQIRKVLGLSVTFDHRALDGAEAARFLNDVIQLLENPAPLVS